MVLTILVAASCSHERPVYQGAEYYKNLEVPPDLTEPDTGDQLSVPDPSKAALQRFRDNNKLDTVITPKFDGVRMMNYAGSSWLEIDNNVDVVWPKLLNFWEIEGIRLAQVRPLLGFMETDWTVRLQKETGVFKAMFQNMEPDQKDRFRLRVERFDNDTKTLIYISHSRIERQIYGEYAEEFNWVTMPGDIEVERELISRLALFAGINKDQSLQLVENYRPYSSLVSVDRSNNTALTMTGSLDFVWSRARRALDRMGMQDIKELKSSNTISFFVAKLSGEALNVEEDELSKSSWLMRMFSSSDEDVAVAKNRQYRLEFSRNDARVKIEVKDTGNSQTTDEEGDVYGTSLAEQIRDLLIKNMK